MGAFGGVALVVSVALVLRSQQSPTEPSTSSTQPEAASVLQLPTSFELKAAKFFASKRAGRVSFAVFDRSGALACYRCRSSYHSASVIKAMLLVSYLDGVAASGEALPAGHKADLESMIRTSDNDAATAIYGHVGDEGLRKLADRAQMTDFRVSGSWGSAHITAADQARFLVALDELTASEYRDYARALLSSVVPSQSWGIPEVSRPEWQTFFKGGWLTTRRGSLVHQVARLEKGGSVIAIAVLTDSDPSDAYGRETIRGIAARVLRSVS